MVRGKGTLLRTSLNEMVTPEHVRNVWDKVTDMSNALHVNASADIINEIVSKLEDVKDNNNNNNPTDDYSSSFTFGSKDLMLYALGGSKLYKNQKLFSVIN